MKPFQAIRYNLNRVKIEEVVTPPYDVISPSEQQHFYEKSPYNMIRLDLSRPESGDTDQNNRYTRAAADFRKWIGEGVLIRDEKPSFYLYEQAFKIDGKSFMRRGLFGLRRLESFGSGKIYPHEKTIAGPKADRLLLMKGCGANFSSIFGIYSDEKGEIRNLLAPLYEKKPLMELEQDGVGQKLWVVSEPETVRMISSLLEAKPVVIADGHHRYETALTYRDWRLSQDPHALDGAPFRYVLMYLASRDKAVVQPTHRVLRDIPKWNRRRLEARLEQIATVQVLSEKELFAKLAKAHPDACRFGIGYPGGEFRLVEIQAGDIEKIRALEEVPPLLRAFDVAVVHKIILEDLCGLSKTDETDPRFVEFVKSREAGLKALTHQETQCVLFMTPPDLGHMEKVVHSGLTMPPKTTYFYPKLLTGLVINSLDD